MANLSERLSRALEDISASPDVSDDSFSALADAKSALDLLTVEGLAGVIGDNFSPNVKFATSSVATQLACKRAAQAVRDYITTPSVEESQ